MAQEPLDMDERYVVNQHSVNTIRELRLKGLSYRKIAKQMQVSYHTVYYWCNDDYRKKKQEKNAKIRCYGKIQKIRTKKQNKKRKYRWIHAPETRIECDYWSAVTETRTKRITSKGRSMAQLKEEYNKTKALTSQKIF